MTNPKKKKENIKPSALESKGSIREAIEQLRTDPAARLPSSQDTYSSPAGTTSEEHVEVVRKGTRKGFSELNSGEGGIRGIDRHVALHDYPTGSRFCQSRLTHHHLFAEKIKGSWYFLHGKIPGKVVSGITRPDGTQGKAVVMVQNPATEKEEIVRDEHGNQHVLFYVDEALKPITHFPPRDQGEPKG